MDGHRQGLQLNLPWDVLTDDGLPQHIIIIGGLLCTREERTLSWAAEQSTSSDLAKNWWASSGFKPEPRKLESQVPYPVMDSMLLHKPPALLLDSCPSNPDFILSLFLLNYGFQLLLGSLNFIFIATNKCCFFVTFVTHGLLLLGKYLICLHGVTASTQLI